MLKKTKSKYIITDIKYLKIIVKKYCNPIIVKNVLKSVAKITKLFYPESLNDVIDFSLSNQKKKL